MLQKSSSKPRKSKRMKSQPFFFLLMALILGIIFQDHFNLNLRITIGLLIVGFLALFLGFTKNFYFVKFKDVSSIIFIFFLGVFILNINKKSPPELDLNKKETLIFSLDKKLNTTEKNRRYEVSFYKDDISFKSILTIPKDNNELDFSHYYKAEVLIKKTKAPYADFIFNYQKYLARKDIFYEAYLPKTLSISESKELSFDEKIKNKRLKILNQINESGLSPKSAAFLKGIILADRTEMDSQTISDFQNSGLIHLLAISGTHIGIIFGLIYFIFLKIFPVKFRNTAVLLSLIFIWMFALFIGLGNSVVRSCIMITIYMIYIFLQRKPDLLHALSLAGFCILIFSPQQIFDVGFQLSFAAVLGIYWLNKPILKLIPESRNKFLRLLRNVLSITVTAQIATLPLILFYFHQFSFISIIANLVVIPLAEIIIAFSLFITIILSLGLNIKFVNLVYDFLISQLLKLIHVFGNVDFGMNRNISVNLIEVVLLVALLYFLRFVLIKFNWKNLFYCGAIFITFAIVRTGYNYSLTSKNEVISHEYFDRKLLSIKNGKEIFFLIPQKMDEKKVKKYIINPYLISVRCKDFKTKKVNSDIKSIVINKVNYPIN